MSILDQVKAEYENKGIEEIKAELAKVTAQRAAQREKQKTYNTKPENLEKRKAYNVQRNSKPEVKEQRKAYMAKPEVKERQKAYRQTRNAKIKVLLARAKELGITGADAS